MSDSPSRSAGIATLDWVGGVLRRNPEGLLLLGAGIALLLRGGSAGIAEAADRAREATVGMGEDIAQPVGEGIEQAMDSAQPAGGAAKSYLDEAMESAQSAAEAAKSYLDQAMDGARAAAERTKSSLSAASTYADRARATLTEQSSRLKQQSQSAFNQGAQLFRDRPLAFAALGIGVGVALAAILPATEIEERVVRPARDTLAGPARGAGERVVRASGIAGNELVHAIRKRGFDEAGVKEIVNEVASSFSGALGEQNHSPEEPRGDGSGDHAMAPAAS